MQPGSIMNGAEGSLTIHDGPGTDFICEGTFTMNTNSLTVNGTAEFGINCTFNMGSMTHIGGTGQIDFLNFCNFSINGGDHHFDGGTIRNYTTCEWSGGDIYFNGTGTAFFNYNQFNISTDNDFYVTGTSCVFGNSDPAAQIVKNGSDETIFPNGLEFDNVGELSIATGKIGFYNKCYRRRRAHRFCQL